MASPGIELSVVVATHNRKDRLARLLAGLRRQTVGSQRFEVVVVDDGSSDGTAELLRRETEHPGLNLRTIARDASSGPARARDLGWRASTAPVVAFTDDDCVPTPGWLQAGLAALEDGVFVQGLTEADPGDAERRGPFSRTIEVSELDPAFQTCNMFYPRALLERVGGFDIEAFGRAPGGEDSDLAWRAIAAGARPKFEPDALVRHAVADLGPIGKLRVAARWGRPMRAYARHPQLRHAHFHRTGFWKGSHFLLAFALVGGVLSAFLPRRLRSAAALLSAAPYLRHLRARGIVEGGGIALAPYFALHDMIELATATRASIRYRTPML